MTNIFQDYNQKNILRMHEYNSQLIFFSLSLVIPVYVSLKNYAKTTIVKIFFFLCLLNYEQNGTHKKNEMMKHTQCFCLFICYTTEMLQFREYRCTFIIMKE